MELWASSNKVVNSIVTNNSVDQGQHLIKSTEPLQILHSVITSNTSGLFTHRRNLDIANSIIVDNGVNQIVTSNGATVSLYNNFIDVSSLNALIAADSGNLFTTGSSLFVDKASGDYTPSSDLLIDRALPSLSGFMLPDTDINGADRSVGCSPDIGAIEVQVSDAVCTDTDGDGVNDISDADDDNDGQPDSYETTYGLDPLDASDASSDLDGDGLTNVEEYNYQTNPLSTDTDDDGVNDNEEIEAGLNPADVAPYIVTTSGELRDALISAFRMQVPHVFVSNLGHTAQLMMVWVPSHMTQWMAVIFQLPA